MLGIVAAAGCHRPAVPVDAVEQKEAPLTSTQVTAARAAGYLPTLTPAYAAIELFDDPVSIPSSNPTCVTGAGGVLINNSGVVVGFDCRAANHFAPQSSVVETPVYSDPSVVGPLSTSVVNHAPTYALPIPATARSTFPTFVNDSGVMAGFSFTPSTNSWAPFVLWNADHTVRTLSGLPSSATISGLSDGLSPLITGAGVNGSTPAWLTFDTATATAPTFLAGPTGFAAGNVGGRNNRGDVVGSYAKADGTAWAETNENGQWVDVNVSLQGTNPLARIEGLRSVNNNRQAVGYGLLPGGTSSTWYRRAVKIDLNTHTAVLIPNITGWTYPAQDHVAKSINAKGHVVGSIMAGSSFAGIGYYPQNHAFVWTQEWGTRDLNSFVNPALGLTLTEAYAINDNDEIVGLEVHAGGGYRLYRMKIDVNAAGPEFFEPTAGQTCSLAVGINNGGVVTGWSDACGSPWQSTGQAVPFATTNGVPTVLGAVSGAVVHPFGIDDAGIVAATGYNASSTPHASGLSYSGSWASAAVLPYSNAETDVTAVNHGSSGPIFVGDTIASDGHSHFYSYQNGLAQTVAGPAAGSDLDGYLDGGALAVNDQGDMVGYYSQSSTQRTAAIVTASGGLHNLNTSLPAGSGWTLTMALGVNNGGDVVGFGARNGAHRPFKLNTGTHVITDLGTLEAPNDTLNTNAQAINNLGHVVGTAGSSQDAFGYHMNGTRAFFYTDDSGMTDLNTLVNVPSGWVFADASGINDNDEVVGYAVQTSTSLRRAYKVKVPTALPVTVCSGKADGTPCNDLNRCTQTDTCQGGVCTGGNPVVCPAPDQCHLAGTCQAATGVCTNPNKQNNIGCNDGSACTTNDLCQNGLCVGTAVTCTALDQCHVAGTCSPSTGCSNPTIADGTACNDSNACTQTDTCQAGTCTGGNPLTCSAGDVCHTATCDGTQGLAPYPTNGLLGLWHLDGNGHDSSDAGNNFAQSPGTIVAGKLGQAYQLTAANGAFNTPAADSNDLATSSGATGATFAAWVKPGGACPGSWLVMQRNSQFALELSCTSAGAPGVAVAVNTGSGFLFSAPFGSVPMGQWSFIAGTWDSPTGTATIYVNGAAVGTLSKQGAIPSVGGGYLYLGGYPSGVTATIDEAAAYARALTPMDISALITAPNPCSTAPKCKDQDSCHTATCDAGGNCAQTQKAAGASCASGNACIDGGATCDANGWCQGGTPHACLAPSNLCSESTCDPYYTPLAASDYIAQWHFEGSFVDATGRGNDMTTGTSTVQAVAGTLGQAMHVDGVSTSCVSRAASPANNLDPPLGITFLGWVKPDAGICPSSVSHVVLQRNGEFGVTLGCKSDNTVGVTLGLSLSAGNYATFGPVGTLPIGQWSHVAITWDRYRYYIYVNGQQAGAAFISPGSDIVHAASTLYLGCGTAAAIDEVSLLRRALSAPEVLRQYLSPALCNVHAKTCQSPDSCHTMGSCNATTGACTYPARTDGSPCSDGNACTAGDTCQAGSCQPGSSVNVTCAPVPNQCQQNVCDQKQAPAPPSNGLVGWWRFDGDTRDSGPNGLDLTNYGATLTGGKIGSAYDFDGSTSCIGLPLTNSKMDLSGAAGVTMMAWVRTPPGSVPPVSYTALMAHGLDYSMATLWAAPMSAPGVTGQVHLTTATGWGYPTGSGLLPLGTWTHVAITWDKNRLIVYVNGQVTYSYLMPGTITNGSTYFNIGCFWGYPQWSYKGAIDEAVLYGRALSQSELLTYIGAVNTTTCAPQNKLAGTSCSDGNGCTTGDACNAGTCVPGTPATCTAQDQCHVPGTCDPTTGACSNPAVADGVGCNDGNACTQTDSCHAGACTGANPVTCAATDGCHAVGTCAPSTGACSNPIQPGGSCSLGIWAGSPTIVEPTQGMTCSAATGINAAGSLVGYSDVCAGPDWPATQAATAFMVAGGTFQPLAAPSGATAFFPSAVNDSGYVVGNASGASPSSAYVHRPGSSGPPEALSLGTFGSKVWAVAPIPDTELPMVAGQGITSGAGGPYVWTSTAVQPVGNAPNAASSFAPPAGFSGEGAVLGMNQQGDMVGYYTDSTGAQIAMVSVGGGPVRPLFDLLDPLAAYPWALETAVAINNDRRIIGVGKLNGTRTAFRADLPADGSSLGYITTIENTDAFSETLLPYVGLLHKPTAINTAGIIVGTIGTPVDSSGKNLIATRAFIDFEDTIQDLNNFVSLPPGWVLIAATGINDSNQISGVALNPATGLPVAYEVTAQGLPSRSQLECAQSYEGAPCTHGTFCDANNVCHNGVCGGADPADAVCLDSDGVAAMDGGKVVALLGYHTSDANTVMPTINEIKIDGVVQPNPAPPPPAWFPTGTYPDIFKPTFTAGAEHQLTWRVNGQMVKVTGDNPLIPQHDEIGPYVMFGSRRVDLPRNLDGFSQLPDDLTSDLSTVPRPPLTDTYKGVLQGKLEVGPTGAATYTLPIALPPGIAGMVPNLSLVYNSQAADGIAGQGWQLSGLSLIHRCPNTRVTDKIQTPVDLGANPVTGGYCIDGKKIFQKDDGTLALEINDYSTIKKISDAQGFVIETKSGERRYYGRQDTSQVKAGPVTVIWALDRVIDPWGNYYDITYNNDHPEQVPVLGLQVTEILYTGHLSATSHQADASPPFYKVDFGYQYGRKDPRSVRIGSWTMMQHGLLSTITTPLGTYALTYKSGQAVVDDTMLPSQLDSIQYCAYTTTSLAGTGTNLGASQDRPTTCLDPITFEWEGGGFAFQLANGGVDNHGTDYTLPAPIDSYPNGDDRPATRGTLFVDMDGDGRLDLVRAAYDKSQNVKVMGAWRNTGNGWQSTPEWELPNILVDGQGLRAGSLMADFDGDGLLDFVTNGLDQFCNNGNCVEHPSFHVYLNRVHAAWDSVHGAWSCPNGKCWVEAPELSELPPTVPSIHDVDVQNSHNQFADMDGDGRVDLVIVTDPVDSSSSDGGTDANVANSVGDLYVYLNKGNRWEYAPQFSFAAASAAGAPGIIGQYHIADVNRDGLADLAANDASNNGRYGILLNQGADASNVWSSQVLASGFGAIRGNTNQDNADISSDGYVDALAVPCSDASIICDPSDIGCQTAFSEDRGAFHPPPANQQMGVLFGTGMGFQGSAGSSAFADSLASYLTFNTSGATCAFGKLQGYSAVDLNADGYSDMILSTDYWHDPRGQVLVNTGEVWRDIEKRVGVQTDPGTRPVPFYPNDGVAGPEGKTFVDLDGDGVLDVVKAAMVKDGNGNNHLVGAAYLNKFRPPHITGFPSGLAQRSTVSYVATTSLASGGTYSDTNPIAPGTKALAMPLWVVSTVQQEDGAAVAHLATTTYKYESLRASTTGRGNQGFLRTTVITPDGMDTAGTQTTTTYAQVYPYTGRPIQVDRTRLGVPISTTINTYCDTPSTGTSAPSCRPQEGPAAVVGVPPKTTLTVYASSIVDTAHPVAAPDTFHGADRTTTLFKYDIFGNGIEQDVFLSRVVNPGPSETLTEQYSTTIKSLYGASGSVDEAQGKVTDRTITTTRIDKVLPAISHRTTYEYDDFGGYTFNGENRSARALLRTRVEPGPDPTVGPDGKPANASETDTVFFYDSTGNVTITTVCASDFEQCWAGNTNPYAGPSGSDNRYHPHFRTTKVSYDPGQFDHPPGLPVGALPYVEKGRFPVRTTNAQGFDSFSGFDPRWGLAVQTTDQNGVHTCADYDDFGRLRSQTERCGSAKSLKTTTQYFQTDGYAGDDLPVATVTTAPTLATTWVFSDVLGRARMTLNEGFDGSLIRSTSTTYDDFGRVSVEMKPTPYTGRRDDGFATRHHFDNVGTEYETIQDLGPIAGAGTSATSDVTRYNSDGWTTVTVEAVTTGVDPSTGRSITQYRQHTESKNVLGKPSAITAGDGLTLTPSTSMTYQYDVDGNVTDACDTNHNDVQAIYDLRGRKTNTMDPDLGQWKYVYDGFGDLREQTDAKGSVTAMTYDTSDRMTTKTDPDGASEWVWDQAPSGIGKLAGMNGPVNDKLSGRCDGGFGALTDGNRARRWFTYTPNGDVQEEDNCIDGAVFPTNYGYDDPLGRLTLVTYPDAGGSRLTVRQSYTKLGYVRGLTDESTGQLLWAPKSMNALGQVTDELTRNGVETYSDRNPSTGWLQGAKSTSYAENKTIQNWTYTYDEVGSMRSRSRTDDLNDDSSQETFGYDILNRLTTSHVHVSSTTSGYDSPSSFGYDPLGNLTSKDGNTYRYDSSCSAGGRPAGPHAVCAIGDNAFAYDGNGNMISGSGRTIDYNATNKAVHVTSTGTARNTTPGTVEFAYGADGNRVLQVSQTQSSGARTVYVGLGGTGQSLYERTTTNSTVEYTQFIAAAGTTVALRVTTTPTEGTAGTTGTVFKFLNHDHLGSVTAVSDEAGHVVSAAWGGPGGTDASVMGYDPWGTRRSPDGRPADPASFASPPGHREFTGQETIPSVGLINLNGRVFDPELGRFTSPDPTLQAPSDPQDYNRYTYALNNPLKYTDPTGYYVVNGEWDPVINFGLMAGTAVACATGYFCVAAITVENAWMAASMHNEGASWDQAIGIAVFSEVLELGSMGVAAAADDMLAPAVFGFASQTMVTLAQSNGQFDDQVLFSIAMSALETAATLAAAATSPVSQSSAEEANGSGGSGATRAEAAAHAESPNDAVGGAGRLVLDESGNPLYLADNQTTAPTSCGSKGTWRFSPEVMTAGPISDVGNAIVGPSTAVGGAGLVAEGVGKTARVLSSAPGDVTQLSGSKSLAQVGKAGKVAGKVLGMTATVLSAVGGAVQMGQGMIEDNPTLKFRGAMNIGAAIGGAIVGGVPGFLFGLTISNVAP